MQARRSPITSRKTAGKTFAGRLNGIALMETLVSVVVGTILLYAVTNTICAMYRTATDHENQVLASNMAQQVLDHVRDLTYTDLGNLITNNGQTTSLTQTINLYQYPTTNPTPANSIFPRPLLMNESVSGDVIYSTAAKRQRFNGTVQCTLTKVTGADAYNVTVNIAWKDQTGPHSYSNSTRVDRYGIHSY